MKNRLIVFSVIFLLLLTVLFISIFLDVTRWITAAIILTEFLFVVLIAGTAARYLNQVFQESNAALNIYEKDGSLSFWDKFGRIRSNLKEINSRTQRVAGMITNLTNPEDINVENNLPEQDPVRKALTEIKLVMKKIKDEDNQRSWVAEGLAQFSATLRNKGEIKEQASRIISSLVKYLNANQGGLYFEYVSEEGDRYLELMASYAYGKQKFVEGRVFEGQGILGQCMLERDFVFLTDIPPGYVKITSGLGEATPRNIVVVPLIFNDTFCGAIELAFFEVMPPHKVEFLKKVAEDIASEVISIRNYERTSKLLEASNTLTVELQSREEEMKQSLEELAATQEEMLRKQIELSGIIHAIDSTLATAELDTDGRIIKHNIILEQFLGYNNEELQQRNFNLIVGTSDRDFGWSNILDGTVKSGDFKTHSKSGLEVWLSITFTPIKDSANRVIRFLCMIQASTHIDLHNCIRAT
jgi:PAS domain S-box-containing protein